MTRPMTRVYLAGPINGCTDAEALDWRAEVTRALAGIVECVSPMRRDYRGKEAGHETKIVEGDKADIDACDIVLAMAERPSWGTAMEIGLAADGAKLVVAVCPDASPSPWLVYHAEVVPTLGDAITLILGAIA